MWTRGTNGANAVLSATGVVNISTSSVLGGNGGNGYGLRFLHGAGAASLFSTSGDQGDLLPTAGSTLSRKFSLSGGDQLDLRQLLAGAPLAADLTNIGDYVKVVGYGRNDPGFGHGVKTMLEVTGPGGSAQINLEGSGKLQLKDLLANHSLLLPPH